ncbi:MAG: GGDEF domain-containing protein [Rhodospirillaceae bacterium]
MIFESHFGQEKEAAYQMDRAENQTVLQRWFVLVGGGLYCLGTMWVAYSSGQAGVVLGNSSLMLLAFTLILFAASFIGFVQDRAELLPILFALAFATHIAFGTASLPDSGDTRFALLMGLLCIYVTALSPTLLISLAAVASALVVAVLATLFLFPLQDVAISMVSAFGYLAPALAIAVVVAFVADRTAREAFSYKWELSRRATTDELSGVANKTHIRVLANNEFTRARRYNEPFSCIMFEIDGLAAIRDTWGDHAADTVARVFAGYCVLVMRHCDSFGRLSERRFVALLPETPGTGALTLAHRMVDDLKNLEVNVYGEIVHFTVSAGVTEASRSDHTGNDLLKRVEQGLEDAIEQGREKAVFAASPQRAFNEDTKRENTAPTAELA